MNIRFGARLVMRDEFLTHPKTGKMDKTAEIAKINIAVGFNDDLSRLVFEQTSDDILITPARVHTPAGKGVKDQFLFHISQKPITDRRPGADSFAIGCDLNTHRPRKVFNFTEARNRVLNQVLLVNRSMEIQAQYEATQRATVDKLRDSLTVSPQTAAQLKALARQYPLQIEYLSRLDSGKSQGPDLISLYKAASGQADAQSVTRQMTIEDCEGWLVNLFKSQKALFLILRTSATDDEVLEEIKTVLPSPLPHPEEGGNR